MLLLLALLPLLAPALAANDTCPPSGAAHVIVARASLEPQGFGIIGAVSSNVVSMLPGSNQEQVFYPAAYSDYFPSEQAGVTAMKGLITSFAKACPHSAIVCMGYSQGAQVTADSLIGTDDKFIPGDTNSSVNAALPQSVLDQVAAVVLMGDPSHVPGLSFDVGNSSKSGIFPRVNSNLFQTTGLALKIHSYCDFNDTYCDSGSSSLVHIGYVLEYGDQAAQFVVDRVKAWAASNGTSNATSSGNSSTSGTATATGTMASGTSMPSGSSSMAASASPSGSSSAGDAFAVVAGPASWNALLALVLAFAAGLAL